MAAEGVAVDVGVDVDVADGREVVRRVLVISNVGAQLEVLVGVAVAGVDALGEQVELSVSTDDVGVVGAVAAIVQAPVFVDCKARGSGGVFVAVAVAGNGGLHPVGAGCQGHGGGVGAVLRRAVFIGDGATTEVSAVELGHRCCSLKVIGTRDVGAAVRRLGDGDLVGLCR